MRRMIQILERCIEKLEQIVVTDPMQPEVRYVATSGLPEHLDQIRRDLENLKDQLEGEPK